MNKIKETCKTLVSDLKKFTSLSTGWKIMIVATGVVGICAIVSVVRMVITLAG